jgi:magnesium transporter
MTQPDVTTAINLIRAALAANDLDTVVELLQGMKSPDQAEIFEELEDEDRVRIFGLLEPSESADILEEMEDIDAAELIQALPPQDAIRIVDEMEPDEAADLLGDITDEQAATILAGLDHPEEIRPLLLHPDDSAGGLMTSEFLALRRRMTAAEAIEAIRAWQPDAETIYYLYVVDGENRLSGVVSLRQLIVAQPTDRLQDIMDSEVLAVPEGTDQEEVARLMSRYDLLSLPVVDERQVLRGVITIDDVVDVLEDESTEDIQKFGGAQPLDQPYLLTRVTNVARKRIGWLLLLFLTGSLTGTVMQIFENELDSMVALAYFVPLLIGTGGNAGSQTTSTIIRALAVGEIDLGDAFWSLWHELRVGLILGVGMAVFAFIRAITWEYGYDLAVTVALAILMIVVWANALGAILPLLVARLKMDPTVVSGPVMSTLVDATGLFIYFTIARLILGF